MTENAIEVLLPKSPPTKFETERRAFHRLLPTLLANHRGKYVAIHEEKVVDSGDDQAEVAIRVQRRFGAVPIYVHLVGEDAPPARSGVLRNIDSGSI